MSPIDQSSKTRDGKAEEVAGCEQRRDCARSPPLHKVVAPPLTFFQAVRIIKTAKQLGIETVSIYTSADAASLHVSDADEAVLLPSLQSYTDGAHIIEVAKTKGCDAIIPGYGFLSENAAFAKDVTDAGLAWVGPSEDAIKAFGIKHTARDLAKQSGVPIVPGTEGLVESEDDAVEQSSKLGFPVMLKITAGGGGKPSPHCF